MDKSKRKKSFISKDKQTRKEVFRCVASDDMPDGAYLAMAEEFGLEAEDLVNDTSED